MQLARLAAKVLLTFIVLCETGVAWRLWRHGPPMELVTTGEQLFKWVRIPLSASDWTILITVIALQVALVWFLWWSRRRSGGPGPTGTGDNDTSTSTSV